VQFWEYIFAGLPHNADGDPVLLDGDDDDDTDVEFYLNEPVHRPPEPAASASAVKLSTATCRGKREDGELQPELHSPEPTVEPLAPPPSPNPDPNAPSFDKPYAINYMGQKECIQVNMTCEFYSLTFYHDDGDVARSIPGAIDMLLRKTYTSATSNVSVWVRIERDNGKNPASIHCSTVENLDTRPVCRYLFMELTRSLCRAYLGPYYIEVWVAEPELCPSCAEPVHLKDLLVDATPQDCRSCCTKLSTYRPSRS
jgi:hypothetical protein